MDNKNLTFFLVIIILSLIFWNNSSKLGEKEGFENISINNQSYNKYNETYLQPDEDYSSKDNKKSNKKSNKNSKNYNNNKKNNIVWENMNLDQCLQKCSDSKDCVAISRDYTEDHEKANCYPREILGVVHSNRKGNNKQRKHATQYNTYVKSNIPNQIRCINDNKLNMNQNVLIKSFKLPKKYIAVCSNEIKLKSYKLYGSTFLKEAQFKLIPGLEGSGTVSFKLSHLMESDYYLSATKLNTLTIKNIYSDNTTFTKRCNASFELIDGLSDKKSISLKTFNSDGPGKFVSLSGHKERLKLVDEQEVLDKNNKFDLEDLTFELVDSINHNNIIEEGQQFQLMKEKDTFYGETENSNYKLRKFPKKIRNKLMSQIHPNDINEEVNDKNNNENNDKNYNKFQDIKNKFQNSENFNNSGMQPGVMQPGDMQSGDMQSGDIPPGDGDMPSGDEDMLSGDMIPNEEQNNKEYQNIMNFLMLNQDKKTPINTSSEDENKLIIKDTKGEYKLPLLKYNYDYRIIKKLLNQNNSNSYAIINNVAIPHGITVSIYNDKFLKKDYYSNTNLNDTHVKLLSIKMNNQNPYFKYAQDEIEKQKLDKYDIMAHFYPKNESNKNLLKKKNNELKQLKDLNYKIQMINQDNELLNQDLLMSSKGKHDEIKLQKLARDYFFLKNKYERSGDF